MTPADYLPTERDFDPWIGDLDAQCAWKHFGGLTLEEALAKFRENPLYFQEDFMFMGGRAFAYYFPVIENHLNSVSDAESDDDHGSWILAHCIRTQFGGDNLTHVRHLVPRVIQLAGIVCDNIHRFGGDDDERQGVATVWRELVHHVRATVES